jgi:hypothetical protein
LVLTWSTPGEHGVPAPDGIPSKWQQRKGGLGPGEDAGDERLSAPEVAAQGRAGRSGRAGGNEDASGAEAFDQAAVREWGKHGDRAASVGDLDRLAGLDTPQQLARPRPELVGCSSAH